MVIENRITPEIHVSLNSEDYRQNQDPCLLEILNTIQKTN